MASSNPLVDINGRPFGSKEPDLIDPDGRPLFTEIESIDSSDEPVEAMSPTGNDAERAAERAKNSPFEPAVLAAELIAKQKVKNLSASERNLLRASLMSSEMASQNLVLWVALHAVASGMGIDGFQIKAEKIAKWGQTHPSKWPISAARLASGGIAFEILKEIPEQQVAAPEQPQAEEVAGDE